MDQKFVAAKLAYERAMRETQLALVMGDPAAYKQAEEKEVDAHQRLLAVAESTRKVNRT